MRICHSCHHIIYDEKLISEGICLFCVERAMIARNLVDNYEKYKLGKQKKVLEQS